MREFLVLFLLPAALAQEPAGHIHGVVVDSVSHTPLRRAQVSLLLIKLAAPASSPGHMRPQTAVTGAGGAFVFRGLAAGTYSLHVQHPSYPLGRRGLRQKTILVKAGETARPTVELIPGASVSGRILDGDGDPIVGCTAEVGRPGRSFGGSARGWEASDENGEYRNYGIEPGRYIVSVRCQQPVFEPRPLSPGPPPPPSLAYAPQFYPMASDPKAAQVIALGPGVEKRGIDFRLSVVPVYTLRGTLVGPAFPMRQDDFSLTLAPRNQELWQNPALAGAQVDPERRTFEFRRVFPGSYTLTGYTRPESGVRFGVRQSVDVTGNILDMAAELRPAVDLTGTVEMEGDMNYQPGQITLQFMPGERSGMPSPEVRTAGDGTFTATGVFPSLWRVQVFGPSVFVKSVSQGGRETTNGLIDSSGSATEPVHVVVSTKTATIRGTGPPGALIQVIGEEEWRAMQSFIDDRGVFSFSGLAPGTYRLVLTDDTEREDSNKEVTLSEGETAEIRMAPGAF